MTTPLRLPPGPRRLPLVGSLPALLRDPLAFFRGMTLDHGPIAYARIGPGHMYVVSEPALIDELLNGHPRSCIKDGLTRGLFPLVGQGLLTSEGELWKRQRKLAAQPFAPRRITAYADTMVDLTARAARRYVDGEKRDFHVDIMGLTLDIASKTLLGVSTEEESTRMAALMEDILMFYEERIGSFLRLLPASTPTPRLFRFRRAKAELDGIVLRIIADNRANDAGADHLLARLIRARDENGQPMSEQQLLDEAITMLLAGHETTALTLMYAVYLLSTNPAAAARLRDELDSTLEGRTASAADLEAMPYLDAVVREAMRLYPPAYAFGREVVEPFALGGYTMPVGAQVVVSTYGMHRDPRFFPEPERFLPERWLEGGSARSLPRYAYLPFGGGHRICIGSHFAQLEAGLVLATLLQQVELHVVPGFQLRLQPIITMRSRHGLPVRVSRRRPRVHKPDNPHGPRTSFDSTTERDAAALAGCPHAAALRTSTT